MLKSLVKQCTVATLILISPLVLADESPGSTFTTRFGPAAVGGGGPNPLGIPPGPTDIEFCYVTKSLWETNVALSPGLLFGRRWVGSNGFYLSSGGGIVLSRSGGGLGGYTSFGGDFGKSALKTNVEFKQALGIASGILVSPYALRVGVSYVF